MIGTWCSCGKGGAGDSRRPHAERGGRTPSAWRPCPARSAPSDFAPSRVAGHRLGSRPQRPVVSRARSSSSARPFREHVRREHGGAHTHNSSRRVLGAYGGAFGGRRGAGEGTLAEASWPPRATAASKIAEPLPGTGYAHHWHGAATDARSSRSTVIQLSPVKTSMGCRRCRRRCRGEGRRTSVATSGCSYETAGGRLRPPSASLVRADIRERRA